MRRSMTMREQAVCKYASAALRPLKWAMEEAELLVDQEAAEQLEEAYYQIHRTLMSIRSLRLPAGRITTGART